MKRLRWTAGAVAILLTALLLATTASFAVEQQASHAVATAFPPRGEFVTVNRAKMHVICQGTGDPALVLQAGIGGGALDWLPLMSHLSAERRVCAFDRLGQDWSDPAPMPRTFATAADDLHRALMQLGIDRPMVVGHSLGGAVVQLYAARYDVTGVILIDGLTAPAAPAVAKRLNGYQALDGLAKTGMLRPIAGLFADAAYPADLRREMRALRGQATVMQQITAEGALVFASGVDELAAAQAYLDAPLLVIAAGDSGLPEADVFLTGLRDLAAAHPQATYHEVPGAPHYVIAGHAQEVAQLIERWIATLPAQEVVR